ncbi:MAG: Ferritin Dps family protein [Rariglobus sp.]|jgi:starvation-inducible DNA-binding protein|nr:Ferritin Dps family protein [Rariglobus sp.]
MKPNLGLSSKARETVLSLLDRLLADEHVLYVKTRNFHWNVTGLHFGPLHTLFEKQYGELAEAIDEIAERIRSLGGVAPGSMKEFLKLSRIDEQPGGQLEAEKMIAALLSDHESVIRSLRSDIEQTGKAGDAGTNDFLTGLLEDHEKTAWMLRAHLS